MVKTPLATKRVKRPRVLGMVIVLVLRALLGLVLGYIGNVAYSRFPEQFQNRLPLLIIPALGIAYLVAAILICMYRRIGLYLCLALVIFEVLSLIVSGLFLRTAPSSSDLPQLAMSLWVGYYAYKYLTHEPEKAFFR